MYALVQRKKKSQKQHPISESACHCLGCFFVRCPHGIWEVKTKTRLWAWNMGQRLSMKCERPILLKVWVASNKDHNKAPKIPPTKIS